ncbi:MAG: ABC transporter ATP-binding protein, partial [Deltaproteobacteria bacterium]|nr:ABC transporter ATP-binding protein [Deltaproteobacteria bacterium]
LGSREARERSIEMLRLVNIPSPEKRIHEYPYELSGGMRQRVMIAMALCCNPRLVIADEPTTAVDVTIQAQILELMMELREKFSMAIILITHDLGIVANTVERILVMYAGQVVEEGDVYAIFENPLHPYTRGLLKAVPVIDRGGSSVERRLYEIKGVVPSLYRLPAGCNFYPRCERREDRCKEEKPEIREVDQGHRVRCFYPR